MDGIHRQGQREAWRGYVAPRRGCEVDVEVVVQQCCSGKTIEVEAGCGHEAGFHAGIDEPVRGGAEELAAGEVVVDGLSQIVE